VKLRADLNAWQIHRSWLFGWGVVQAYERGS
jgi:hypothetical protein